MNFIFNAFFLLCVFSSSLIDNNYKYILIITSKNCSPCITTADEYLAKNKLTYKLINLYQNKAEKDFSTQTIKNYCKESKHSKYSNVLNKYMFGKYSFNANDGGPFLIKYSKTDTIIYTAENIESVNNSQCKQ